MDEGVKGQYVQFFRTNAGQDLIDRFKTTEAKYMMEAMQATSMESKAMLMAKMEASYAMRTMMDDLATPEKPKSEKLRQSKPA